MCFDSVNINKMSDTDSSKDNGEVDAVKLKMLVRKRGTIKSRITKFKEFLTPYEQINKEEFTTKNISDINLRLTKVNELFQEFESVQTRIESNDSESNLDKRLQERFEIENQFYSVISSAEEIVSSREKRVESPRRLSIGSSSNHHCAGHSGQLRLPTIKLPTFDGNYTKWLEFRDTFDSLINGNETIPDISKFHYLRSSLEGGAAVTIKSIDFTADNYQVAWDLLCNRYNNKNVLINNHLKSFFTLDSLNKESHKSLRFIVDHVSKNLRALNTLGERTDMWDTLIIYIVVQKLDNVTSIKWEEYKATLAESPSLEDFYQFLRNRADVLETVQGGSAKSAQPNNNHIKNDKFNHTKYGKFNYSKEHSQVKSFFSSASNNRSCFMCNQNHRLFECKMFAEMSPEAREVEITKRKLCLNCLRPGHLTQNCRLSSCRACNQKHNSLLCRKNNNQSKHEPYHENKNINCDKPGPSSEGPNNHNSATASTSVTSLTSRLDDSEVLLGTAIVEVTDDHGNTHLARAMIDCGSQRCFITENLKRKLNIKSNSSKRQVSLLNNLTSCASDSCTIKIKSRINSYTVDVNCMIIQTVSDNIPSVDLNLTELNLPNNIRLADPQFYKSNKIDILIGSDIMWNIVKGGYQKTLGKNGPTLIYSKFGWLVAGPMCPTTPILPRGKILCNFSQEIKDSLSKFWELETFTAPTKIYSTDDQICEELFVKNTIRLDSGRFQVSMPLKESPEVLGDSFALAKRCFFNLERRFRKQPTLKQMYSEFIQEYATLGHLTEIERPPNGNFLPHHPVLREKSETTKLRTVFNGSARTTSGKSLNDIQYVGPVVQNDLLSILLRFRQHKFVLTGDIAKMYRQISLDESQRHLQLILWRDNESQPLRTLQLNTVTYGTASATFLAFRCLVQLSKECADPKIANVIKNDFYCDDLITGSDDLSELKYIRDSVVDKLAEACFPLRKFRTNAPCIFANDPTSNISDEKNLSQVNDQYSNLQNQSSVLGLNWCPSQDNFNFLVDFQNEPTSTKRNILSATCKIFDPLGLLSPCTIVPKMLLQKLWLSGLGWDDPVPCDINKEWNNFISNIHQIAAINIPRFVMQDSPASIQLHCFADASQNAFATCIYIRCVDSKGNVSVKLLCAKARVTQIKKSTIPRYELAAALLGAQLSAKVCQSLTCNIDKKYFWSDSTIVLAWIKNVNPSNLKQFVYNRINEIHELTDKSSWNHVPTDMNPADIASRGISPSHLQNANMWFNGPSFLMKPENEWPSTEISSVELPELKVYTCLVSKQPSFDFDRFSKFHRMIRVVGYILRFIFNCKQARNARQSGFLSNDEINESTQTLIRASQRDSFADDLQCLKQSRPVHRKSKILALNPFLDEHDLIRVGGRIQGSICDYSKKHPILLCSKHTFTKLLFRKEHESHMHCGPQLLLNIVRDQYWPIGGRNLARSTFRKCVVCVRIQGNSIQPMMGNLPPPRVTLTYAFTVTGMDFAGPFFIANRQGRGCKLSKCWLCLFVCLSTKAVHLEVVSSLSTEAFLMTFRRFISRRGRPHDLYCDNGTNFVGACNELGKMLRASQKAMTEAAHDKGIKFHFSPAYSPHFGGIFEAGIKSAKSLLKRVIGNSSLTFEGLTTLFTQIESILNSRPLTPLTSDPSDLSPLTPGHFLIGRPLTALPEPPVTTNCPNRYQKIEQMRQHFWTRFHDEYLSELQQRTKWREKRNELKEGDLVVIKDDNVPPMRWRLGRVHQLYKGRDGITRVADFKTAKGMVKRAVNRVCLLPVRDTEVDGSLASQGFQGGDPVHASTA